jgi:DNA-binding NtrC family response regulator
VYSHSHQHLPYIQAFYKGRFDTMYSILENTEPNGSLYKAYRAFACAMVPRDKAQRDEAASAIVDSINDPPPDSELFILVLAGAAANSIRINQVNKAQHAYNLMLQLASKNVAPDIQTTIHRTQFRIASALDDISTEKEAIKKAVLSSSKTIKRVWLAVMGEMIGTLIRNWEFREAESALLEIKSFRNSNDLPRSVYYDYFKASLAYHRGDVDEGIEIFQNSKNAPAPFSFLKIHELKTRLMIKAGKWDLAESEIRSLEEFRHKGNITTPHTEDVLTIYIESLRAYKALGRKDLFTALEHSHRALALTDQSDPRILRNSKQIRANIELALGRTQSARVILSLLDPNHARLNYTAEWGRLYMLEGNTEKAIECFQKIKNMGIPNLIPETLRYAYEMTPHQVLRILNQTENLKIEKKTQETHSQEELQSQRDCIELLGESKLARQLNEQVERLARTKSTVLIIGEQGLGIRAIAEKIHSDGNNHSASFMAVNCSSLSDTLLESELFGHKKGAFPGAIRDRDGLFLKAGRGTIFLDQIHSISQRIQAALMLCLESGKIHPLGSSQTFRIEARIIIGSNNPLENLFRKDLYFLLSRQVLHLLPLRERKEDIPAMAQYFLKHLHSNVKTSFSEDLVKKMKNHLWPNNTAELKAEVEKMVILAGDSEILTPEMFQLGNHKMKSSSVPQGLPVPQVKAYAQIRLERMQQLFFQNDKLTCRDIIRTLAAAPNTVRKDLQELQKIGFIRRIDTSKNLNSSYYVRTNL